MRGGGSAGAGFNSDTESSVPPVASSSSPGLTRRKPRSVERKLLRIDFLLAAAAYHNCKSAHTRHARARETHRRGWRDRSHVVVTGRIAAVIVVGNARPRVDARRNGGLVAQRRRRERLRASQLLVRVATAGRHHSCAATKHEQQQQQELQQRRVGGIYREVHCQSARCCAAVWVRPLPQPSPSPVCQTPRQSTPRCAASPVRRP